MAQIQTARSENRRSLEGQETKEPRHRVPATDILENEREYLLLADMPGVDSNDLSIQLDANELRIEGRYKGLDGAPAVYRRVFQVGPAIDQSAVSAELKNGVLQIGRAHV